MRCAQNVAGFKQLFIIEGRPVRKGRLQSRHQRVRQQEQLRRPVSHLQRRRSRDAEGHGRRQGRESSPPSRASPSTSTGQSKFLSENTIPQKH